EASSRDAEEGSALQRPVGEAGKRVAVELAQRAKKAQQLTDEAAQADLGKARGNLRQAAPLARPVDGWAGGPRLRGDPVERQRHLLLHDLLCWQAERAYLDHWAADRRAEDGSPYYRLAGLIFLADARSLLKVPDEEAPGKPSPLLAEYRKVRERVTK